MRTLLLSAFFVISIPLAASAAEVRVQDQQGLIRAVRAIRSDKGAVEVRTSEQGAGEMTLVPQNGLGLSKHTKRAVGQSFNFTDVQAGTWQIEGNFQVTEVRVQE